MAFKAKRTSGAGRILVAEDSWTQAEQLRQALEDGGYAVQVTTDGREGLAAARNDPPDLVISDVNMPGMNGYEFCRALKSDGALKDTPFMLVTSLSSPGDVVHGLDCGADNFITKPYDETTLLERVRYLLTNSALRGTSKVRAGIELELGGKVHFITAERHQMLDLLISTYAEAVRLGEEAAERGERLRESFETISALYRGAEGLNKVRTEAEVVNEALQRIQDLPFCHAAWIMETDDDGIVRGIQASGLPDERVSALSAASICSCQRDLHLGKITGVARVADCARLGGGMTPGSRSGHASIPLIGQQRVFGIINVLPREDRDFAPEELRVLSALGNQIAAAMDRAYLNSTLERQVVARTEELRREVGIRQRAESAAVASALRLERAQRIGGVGSVELHLTTGESHWSDEWYRILGLEPRSVPASFERTLAAVHPDDREMLKIAHQRTVAGAPPEPVEFRVVRPDGEVRWVYRHAERFVDKSGASISMAATFRDITDHKRMESEIQRSRQHLAEAQRVGKIGSCAVDLRTGEAYWSDELYNIYGLDRDAPTTSEFFLKMVHPDDRARMADVIVGMLESDPRQRMEFRLTRPDGEMRWFLREARLVRDQNGEPRTLLITNQDITAAKKAEQERLALEAQLRQAQKMEAVGNLTGGIAHDFNNILAVVIGNLDLLKLEMPGGTEASALADTAIEACLKGSELTKSLLAFSRRQPLQPKLLVVNALLERSVKMLSRAIGESVQVQLKLGPGLWEILVDPAQLESALLNMMVNSRDAMPDGGIIVIETRNTVLDEAYAARHAEVTAGDYVVIEISDTGAGMPPAVMQHVFEPFFTTKEKGKGTGLGLAMVFGFVKQSGGHVKIYSEVGHGTTIRVYLPKSGDAGAGALRDEKAAVVAKPRGERILVVEDNVSVRRAVTKQLSGAGYVITEAESAVKAIEMLESGSVIDLIFSDVIMPGGMTGADLAREASRRWPSVKFLMTSGFPEGLLENGNKLPVGMSLLSKPYRMEELLRKLREVLDG